MFSWLTGRGNFRMTSSKRIASGLVSFTANGYVDFEIKDVQFEYPTTNTMTIRLNILKVANIGWAPVTFTGTTMFPDQPGRPGLQAQTRRRVRPRGPVQGHRVSGGFLRREGAH